MRSQQATPTAPASCRHATWQTLRPSFSQVIPNSGSWRCPRRRWLDASTERYCVRTALITGGSGGIGKGCGRKLAELGYDVVLAARREGPLRAAADEMGARYLVADASDPDGFDSAISTLETIDLV